MNVSWSITLRPIPTADPAPTAPRTQVLFRPGLGPVQRVWLATTAGELIDLLTIAALSAGLRERTSRT